MKTLLVFHLERFVSWVDFNVVLGWFVVVNGWFVVFVVFGDGIGLVWGGGLSGWFGLFWCGIVLF